MTTLTLTNPTRTKKFGFGYSTTPERNSTRIIPPSGPTFTGTFASVCRQIDADRTYKSLKSGGTFLSSLWFYDGKPIVDQGYFLDQMNRLFDDREAAKDGWRRPMPEQVTIEI